MTKGVFAVASDLSAACRWGAVLLVALSALACDALDGNGDRGEELRRFSSGFRRVESAGPLHVRVHQGDEPDVRVSIDSNLLSHVTTRVNDEALVVDVDVQIGERLPGPHVFVTVPMLDAVTLDGSGRVEVGSLSQVEAIALALDGSGELHLDGSVSAVDASLNGSGGMELGGSAEDVTLTVNGAGSIDAKSLTARTGVLTLGGSGRLVATVTDRATASVSGSGVIEVYGGATVEPVSVTGSGRVARR
ncbi:MAG: head GIN domain-containing protein [Polyangiaceae bacterium]